MKLQLQTVTLMCVDGVNVKRAEKVIDHCTSLVDFGAVKLLSHQHSNHPSYINILPLNSLVAYSVWMLKECHKYIDTTHVLIVQRDGWILNPQTWNFDWLSYDYIGPVFVQHDDVGSGGFSLRSKRIMEAASKRYRDWDGTEADAQALQKTIGSYEDGVLSMNMRGQGFRYPTLYEAGRFAQGGNRNREYYYPHPFGFHGDKQEIDHKTGFVHPVCEHQGDNCGCRNEHLKRLLQIEQL